MYSADSLWCIDRQASNDGVRKRIWNCLVSTHYITHLMIFPQWPWHVCCILWCCLWTWPQRSGSQDCLRLDLLAAIEYCSRFDDRSVMLVYINSCWTMGNKPDKNGFNCVDWRPLILENIQTYRAISIYCTSNLSYDSKKNGMNQTHRWDEIFHS